MSVKKAIEIIREVHSLSTSETVKSKCNYALAELKGMSALELLLADVCSKLGVEYEDAKRKIRKREVILARYIFFAEARKAGHSLQAIADTVGKHHSSVVYGIRSVSGDDYDAHRKYNEFLNQNQ